MQKTLTTELAEKAGISAEDATRVLGNLSFPDDVSNEDLARVRGGSGGQASGPGTVA
jgi:hypothetical protein